MSDALQVAAGILEVDQVEQSAELGGSRRSIVRRVRAGSETFIVKEYLQPEEMTWSREAAGLKAAAGVRAPRLLGFSEDPAVAVMSDLGSGGNLADALLGTAAGYGASGVLAWAEAIGELQAHAADRLDVFREALADGAAYGACRPMGRASAEARAGVSVSEQRPAFGAVSKDLCQRV
jgi:aminoglycoside/choline kinase family phosphotransferase